MGYMVLAYQNTFSLSGDSIRDVLWFAPIPAFLAVIILIFMVHEPKHRKKNIGNSNIPEAIPSKLRLVDLKSLPKVYWMLMLVVMIYALSRCGESFLTIRGYESFGISKEFSPIIMIVMNFASFLSAYPMGYLSDRMGRRRLLSATLLIMIAAKLLLSLNSIYGFYVGIVLWGLQFGSSQSLFVSCITDVVPARLRGTAIGIFYFLTGIFYLISAVIAGKIWDLYGSEVTFAVASGVTFVALLLLSLVPKIRKYA